MNLQGKQSRIVTPMLSMIDFAKLLDRILASGLQDVKDSDLLDFVSTWLALSDEAKAPYRSRIERVLLMIQQRTDI